MLRAAIYCPFPRGVIPIKKRKNKKKSILFRVAIAVTIGFFCVRFIQMQINIEDRKKVIEEYQIKIAEQMKKNQAIQNDLDNYEQFLERAARERGYGYAGETVYIDIS